MNKNVNTPVNNKKKRKSLGPRFNVFDFLIILTIFVCVGAIIVRAIFFGSMKAEKTTAKVVFEVSQISTVTAEALCIAEQPIYLKSNDMWIGTISSASASPQKVWENDENGVLQSADHPEKKAVRGEAVMSGTWTDDGFWIDGKELAALGKTFDIYTPYVSCTITIISVSENQ